MHIPDGYLSPQTYVPAYLAMAPFWLVASRELKATLKSRQVPLLALGAAFSFVIMMFNIPIIGGSTGHAVGAVLVAVLLGPWAAVVAISIALAVQALMFGDGGITAFAANCLNMAAIMPFAGWGVYRLVAGGAPAASRRHCAGAAAGGYVGLNAAALATALMFGIQPLIAHDAHGRALYMPFGLKVTVPTILGEHLLVFGFVEAIVTGLVIAYIQRAEPSLIPALNGPKECQRRPLVPKLAAALGVLVVLSPLGLYLPARFGAGSAWGEWSAMEMKQLAGYVPEGLRRIGSIWQAPVPDYAFKGQQSGSPASSMAYVISGLVGVGLVVAVVLLLRKRLSGKENDGVIARVDDDPRSDL